MKKGFVAITAAIAIAATLLIGTALAGIGPDRGLPNVDLGQANGYAWNAYANVDASVPGMNGSVMCVACHSRNPGLRTSYNNTNAGYAGSHWVTRNFQDTSRGGGYPDGQSTKTRADRTAAIYMAGTGASATWAANPKYGKYNTGTSNVDNNVTNADAGAQMICESCHNIVKNIGPAKLLATGFANGATNASYTVGGTTLTGHGPASTVPALCIGCHGNMSEGVNAEWKLHPVGTWTGTHHHRNTGTAAYYGTGTQTASHDMGLLGQGYYTQAGIQMWGAAYGELTETTPRALTYESTANKKVRNNILTTAQGQLRVAAAGQVLCTNCHRAHNAATSAGATILMVTATTPAIGTVTAADNTVSGMGQYGRDALMANTNPLCLACHQ